MGYHSLWVVDTESIKFLVQCHRGQFPLRRALLAALRWWGFRGRDGVAHDCIMFKSSWSDVQADWCIGDGVVDGREVYLVR